MMPLGAPRVAARGGDSRRGCPGLKKKRKSAADPAEPALALPDAELEVLACLWNAGQCTARQVRERIAGYRPMAHGSVVTLLQRLLKKGLVTRQKAATGKAFIYLPAQPAGPTYRRILDDLVRRIFGGSGVMLVSSLFETRAPTPDELDQLEKLLDQCRRETGKRVRK